MSSESNDLDTLIIGGGPAGMASALWCADLGIRSLVLEREREFGGQLLRTHNPITNYPGIESPNGRVLRDHFEAQLKRNNMERRIGAEVIRVSADGRTISLATGEELSARSSIIATGTRRRMLNIPGEIEFRGHGVLESGAGERIKATGKRVVVVGGGDAAFENALILAEVAQSVLLVHRSDTFAARDDFVEKVNKSKSIEILTGSELTEIIGDDEVNEVLIRNRLTSDVTRSPAETVVVRIGFEPNSRLWQGLLATDAAGYITTDRTCETTLSGVYAVGDVANPIAPTISGAVGHAATAVKAIEYRLRP